MIAKTLIIVGSLTTGLPLAQAQTRPVDRTLEIKHLHEAGSAPLRAQDHQGDNDYYVATETKTFTIHGKRALAFLELLQQNGGHRDRQYPNTWKMESGSFDRYEVAKVWTFRTETPADKAQNSEDSVGLINGTLEQITQKDEVEKKCTRSSCSVQLLQMVCVGDASAPYCGFSTSVQNPGEFKKFPSIL